MTGPRTTLSVSAAHIATVREYVEERGYETVWTVDVAEPELGRQPSICPRDTAPILAALDALAARIDTLETALRANPVERQAIRERAGERIAAEILAKIAALAAADTADTDTT
jgi:putative hemolysin